MLRKLLAHPLTKGLSVDHPETTELRRLIIQRKPFLQKIYEEWYQILQSTLPENGGHVLELGSGAGFLDCYIPDLITSEIFFCREIKAVVDGQQLPFSDGSLAAIVMSDVFHHLPAVRLFLREAARCIRHGGVVSMIEPWRTPWSSLIFRRMHHEAFDPEAKTWEFPSSGPLSSANQALPWIIFERDRFQFEQEFPMWKIEKIAPYMPLRYLLSGGIATRNLMPAWSFGFWKAIEERFFSHTSRWAMFSQIVLRLEKHNA